MGKKQQAYIAGVNSNVVKCEAIAEGIRKQLVLAKANMEKMKQKPAPANIDVLDRSQAQIYKLMFVESQKLAQVLPGLEGSMAAFALFIEAKKKRFFFKSTLSDAVNYMTSCKNLVTEYKKFIELAPKLHGK